MKFNCLVAIPYFKTDVGDYLKTIQKDSNILLDSGAFTFWKKNKEFSIDQYMKFISNCPIDPWKYFALDVVGDEKKTKLNLDILWTNGFKPAPIFTRGADPKIIDEYYRQSDLIGIGGLVGTRGNKGFIKGIMKHIGKRDVHWLGFTQNDYLHHYRPFSCDSSSWSMALRYGTLDLYIGKGKWKRFNREDFIKRPSDEILRLFKEYEEDPLGFRFESEWRCTGQGGPNMKLLERVAYKAWAKYQIDVEQVLGVKFFVSCAVADQFQVFYKAHLFWKHKMGLIEKPKVILRKGVQRSSKTLDLDKQ